MGTNYHNEALRKTRLLERVRFAKSFPQETDDDRMMAARVMADIKSKHSGVADNSYSGETRFTDSCKDMGTVGNRQSYDHSRNGPIRDDSNRRMNLDAAHLYGRKPGHMYNVWKG